MATMRPSLTAATRSLPPHFAPLAIAVGVMAVLLGVVIRTAPVLTGVALIGFGSTVWLTRAAVSVPGWRIAANYLVYAVLYALFLGAICDRDGSALDLVGSVLRSLDLACSAAVILVATRWVISALLRD